MAGTRPSEMVLYNSPLVARSKAMASSSQQSTPSPPRQHLEQEQDRRIVRARSGVNFHGSVEDRVLGDAHLLEVVFGKLDVASLHAASEVCTEWYNLDARVRRSVTIANCYSAFPHRLTQRFEDLRSIKLKCRPRSVEFQQLVPDWGGYAGPWIDVIARSYHRLESLHLKRAVMTDKDLESLCCGCGKTLQHLILQNCDGFSTQGLLCIAKACRSLRTLSMVSSQVKAVRGEWLKLLAYNNPHLEVLLLPDPGYDPDPAGDGDDDRGLEVADIFALVAACKSLRSLRLGPWIDQKNCSQVFAAAASFRELGTGSILPGDENVPGLFPDRLSSLSGLYHMLDYALPKVKALSSTLQRLDLRFTELYAASQVEIIVLCSNLEVLETRPIIGDAGLMEVGRCCKRLKKLRVETSDVESDIDNEVTQVGLTAVARGCPELECLIFYAANVNNEALFALSDNCTKLADLRLIIVQKVEEHPLIDEGIRRIMLECRSLTKMALAMRKGCLTNNGLRYIGEHGGSRLKWLCLVCTGEGDEGLHHLLRRCHNLRRLEMRNCPFTAAGLAKAFAAMPSPNLRYLWVEGEPAYDAGAELGKLFRKRLHIEVSGAQPGVLEELFAYYSLRSIREDRPATVYSLTPSNCEKPYCGI